MQAPRRLFFLPSQSPSRLPPPVGEVSSQGDDGGGLSGSFIEAQEARFCEAKWEFCKLPSGSCRVSRAGARITRAHPLTPSHASTKRGRIAPRHGRGSFSVSKGGLRAPFVSPHGGEVSPAGSVGVGKAPPALNASPVPPPTRRKFLSCREFRGCETRPSKSNGSETWLVRTSPRKGPLSSGLPQKGVPKGDEVSPAGSVGDGRSPLATIAPL